MGPRTLVSGSRRGTPQPRFGARTHTCRESREQNVNGHTCLRVRVRVRVRLCVGVSMFASVRESASVCVSVSVAVSMRVPVFTRVSAFASVRLGVIACACDCDGTQALQEPGHCFKEQQQTYAKRRCRK